MTDNVDLQAAAEVAMREAVANLLTAPMTVSQAACHFQINRNLAKTMLQHMPGVERCGTLWRLPVWKMPPKYLLDQNLVPRA